MNSNITVIKISDDRKELTDIQKAADYELPHIIYVDLPEKDKVVCSDDLSQMQNVEDIQQGEEVSDV